MNSRRGVDDGLTLIELVISTAILGFILAAVTAAITVVLVSASPTQGRTAASHDKQLIDAYFGSDVQNSVAVATTKPSCAAPSSTTVNTSGVAPSWQDSPGGGAPPNNHSRYYVGPPQAARGGGGPAQARQRRPP